jgi:RNA polymerase sigma factor (TIGR02999 family)
LFLLDKGELVDKSVHSPKKTLGILNGWLSLNQCVNLFVPSSGTRKGELIMKSPSPPNITQLLVAWKQGDQEALAKLTPLVYRELHRLAHGYLAGERPGHVLQTTGLVNEAFVRLIDWQRVEWKDRAHFYGVAATLMRHILVQFAREQHAAKRGGQSIRVSLSEAATVSMRHEPDLVSLDDALTTLEKLDPRQARVVELRFFGGLSIEEAAAVVRVSVSTVRRDWRMAQAWLQQQLSATT